MHRLKVYLTHDSVWRRLSDTRYRLTLTGSWWDILETLEHLLVQ